MQTKNYPEQLAELDFGPLWLELPVPQTSIDPFDFGQRMAAYKLLIEVINPNGIFGEYSQGNPFWGYIFQLYWQWRSGRLALTDTPRGHIDPDSTWGYANYSLSIIPLVGAIQAGLLPALEITPPYRESRVAYISGGGGNPFVIPPTFQKPVEEWQRFMRHIAVMQPGDNLESLRFILWEAHFSSLIATRSALIDVLPSSSIYERDFLLGWIRMVDFLGAAAWRTDLDYMLENGVGVLPERMLVEGDVPGSVPDMDEKVNNNLRNICGLTRQPQWRFDFNLWLWKRAMRTREARSEVLPMLDATFNPSPKNVKERRRLLRYMLKL